LPSCPECGRRIAAWKKDHCVYCGTAFPPDFKQGFAEPEAVPVFGVLFYLVSSMLRRFSPLAASAVLAAGAAFLGYLLWNLQKIRRR